MKRVSLTKWIDTRQRLLRVIDYIDSNLDRTLSLEDLAAIAALSPFHFHRTYVRFVGESPAATVRRLKLNRAAARIANAKQTVTDAAQEAGYASAQSFSRAFSREIGVPPSRIGISASAPKEDDIAIINLPASKALTYDFRGVRAAAEEAFNRIFSYGKLAAIFNPACQIGVVYRHDIFTPLTEPTVLELSIFGVGQIPVGAPLPLRIAEHAEGLHALWYVRGLIHDHADLYRSLIHDRLPALGWEADPARPVIRHMLDDRALTPPSQRRSFFHIPVRPLTRAR